MYGIHPREEKVREKELKLIITFHNTVEAIAFEKMCHREGYPGRLIPVPQQVSAGCGLAWSCFHASGQELCREIKKGQIEYEDVQELML